MQLEGWKCLECGVIYAPFVKECRCSVKIQDNVRISCNHNWPSPDAECLNCGLTLESLQAVCFHYWPDTSAPCTKCGLKMGSGITFTVPPNVPVVDISGCVHIYPDSSLTTQGRFCSLCGAQEVQWETPGNTTVPQGGTING